MEASASGGGVEGSALNHSVGGLLEWMVDCKCKAMGLPVPNRKAAAGQVGQGGLFSNQDVAKAAAQLA
jgi:hypothetical protein